MLFKDRLRELRTAANLTQGELAKRGGMSEKAVQNYELGSRMPRNMKAARKLAAALGTTAEELLCVRGNSGMLIISAHERGVQRRQERCTPSSKMSQASFPMAN